jgi:hypothetical protein
MIDIEETLSPHNAAKLLGLAASSLAKMRCWGGGPPFLKLGRAIRYVRSDLIAWRDARRVHNTSEAASQPHRLTTSP